MTRPKLILALMAGIAASGSALADDDKDKPVEQMPTIRSDDRSVEIRGVSSSTAPFDSNVGRADFEEWFIRSFIDKHTHVVVQHQLYVYIDYSGSYWAVFQTAETDDGDALTVVPLKKRYGTCMQNQCRYSEIVAVVLPETLLRDRVQAGLQVRISGRFGGQVGLWVSPEMIQKQLSVLAEAEKLP